MHVFVMPRHFDPICHCSDVKNNRDPSASWGGYLRPPLKPLGSSQHYRIEGFKGALNYAPIMPRDASVKITPFTSLSHGELDSESRQIKPKSDGIYYFLIDLEMEFRLAPNQSGNGKYNMILV